MFQYIKQPNGRFQQIVVDQLTQMKVNEYGDTVA